MAIVVIIIVRAIVLLRIPAVSVGVGVDARVRAVVSVGVSDRISGGVRLVVIDRRVRSVQIVVVVPIVVSACQVETRNLVVVCHYLNMH